MLHEHHRREQVELQGRKRGVVRDLGGGALRDQSPVRAGRAQVFGFGIGAVIVTVFVVRGCIGNRGLGVEVGFPDVKAGWEGERLRPSRMWALVPEGSERAVVTMGGGGCAGEEAVG